MTLARSRALQYILIISILAAIAVAGWWFYLRSQAGVRINTADPVAPRNGLVAHWKFDEGTGGSAADSSGNNLTGTLNGSPTWVSSGRFAKALQFGGPTSSQYVSVPDPGTGSVLDAGNGSSLSVSFWVYPTSFDTPGYDWGVFLAKGGTTGTGRMNYQVGFQDGCVSTCEIILSYRNAADTDWGNYQTDEKVLTLNKWQHIVLSWTFGSQSSMKLYLNGEVQAGAWVGPFYDTPYQSNDPLWIGADNYSGGEAVDEEMTGRMDDVRIYNRLLTMEEVRDIYESAQVREGNQSGVDSLSQGLVGYWPLDNGSGGSATDASGNGNTGTLVNGPTWNTGQIGGAVAFDGSNDGIDIPDTDEFDMQQSFSLAAWIYPTSLPTSGTWKNIITKTNNGTGTAYWLELTYLLGTPRIEFGHTGTQSTCDYQVPLNAWTHILAVFDDERNQRQFYVNGVLLCSEGGVVANLLATDGQVHIGSGWTGENWPGRIDEARIYSRALSVDEARRLYLLSSPSTPDTGLLSHYTFDAVDVIGTTLYDRGKGKNIGTLTGGPVRAAGYSGQGLRFDGVDDFVTIPESTALAVGDSFTVAAWINPKTIVETSNVYMDIVTKTDGSANQFYFQTAGDEIIFDICGGVSCYTELSTAVANIRAGEWTHVAAVFDDDANQKRIYVNGTLMATNAEINNPHDNSNHTPLVIGGGYAGEEFEGLIDDVRYYDRVLTAAEIAVLGTRRKAEQNAAQYDPGTAGLVGYWPLENGSGTTASDASGNANNLTLTNMEAGDWVAGKTGSYALDMDGTNEYATVADPASGILDDFSGVSGNLFTIAGWFNRDTFTTEDTIVAKANATSGDGYIVWIDAATDRLHFQVNDSVDADATHSVSNTAFTSTGWHSFAAVFRQGFEPHPVIYIDGQLDCDGRDSCGDTGYVYYINSVATALDFRIGAESDAGNPFDGRLDDIRVYNRALTDEEIRKLHLTTGPANPDTSLVGLWSFDGPDIQGTIARDRSGKGNDGTLTGGPTRTTGKIGQGLRFDGASYATMGDPADGAFDFGSSGDFTISGWFRYGPYLRNVNSIVSKKSDFGAGNVGYLVYVNIYSLRFAVSDGVDQMDLEDPRAFNDNHWHHFAAVWDDDSLANTTLYVDGVIDPSVTKSGTIGNVGDISNALPLNIGSAASGGYQEYFGSLDDVRIYNRTLPAEEIQALYNKGK